MIATAFAAGVFSPAHAADDSGKSVSNPNGCKVVERKSSDNNSGTLSSSVTAGNGKVSGYTTGGNSVTVHSGDGSTSSSVATAGGSGNSTVVTSGNGDCTIYVNPGEKKEDRK